MVLDKVKAASRRLAVGATVHWRIPVAVGALVLIVLAYPMSKVAQGTGARLPTPTGLLAADYLLGYAWGVVLGAALLVAPVPRRERAALATIWAGKLAVALGLMLFYEQRYGLDSYFYYASGQEWPGVPQFGDGTRTIQFVSWIHHQIFPGSFHLMKVTFAAVGLAATYALYRAWAAWKGVRDWRHLLVLGLVPSMLFWSSVLGKDPLLLFGLGLVAWGGAAAQRQAKPSAFAMLAFGLLVITFVRAWVGVMVLFALMVFVAIQWARRSSPRARWGIAAGFLALCAAIAWGCATIVERTQNRQVLDYINIVAHAWEFGGSALDAPTFASWMDVVRFLPLGAFTAMFRPLPFEVPHMFGLLAGAENLAILLIILFAMIRARSRHFKDPMAWGLMAYLGAWASLYAFISYQNLGTAARFRLMALPAMLALAAHFMLDRRRRSEVG